MLPRFWDSPIHALPTHGLVNSFARVVDETSRRLQATSPTPLRRIGPLTLSTTQARLARAERQVPEPAGRAQSDPQRGADDIEGVAVLPPRSYIGTRRCAQHAAEHADREFVRGLSLAEHMQRGRSGGRYGHW